MHRPSKVNKVKNRKYLCSTAGMLGPNAVSDLLVFIHSSKVNY